MTAPDPARSGGDRGEAMEARMSKQPGPEEILDFWLQEVGPEGWYKADEALDESVRERFGDLWREARAGAFEVWRAQPARCLALLILLDQFPRNMFRGSAEAFSTDARALRTAKIAVLHGHDLATKGAERQFFYLPMMHSEALQDQDHAVRLFACRMKEEGGDNVLHARAHREIIRRFGRFPHRNEALGRETTPPEAAFMAEGGYGAVLKKLAA